MAKHGTGAVAEDGTVTTENKSYGQGLIAGLTYIPTGGKFVYGSAALGATLRDLVIGHVHGRFVEGAGVGVKIWKGMDPLIGT